jgi:hypothetical protein
MIRYKDITGQRFGRLAVIRPTAKRESESVVWECKCDCGKFTEVVSTALQRGHTKSCGCFYQERVHEGMGKTHGHNSMSGKSGTYQSWDGIIQRCCNPNCLAYLKYGARGIKVCYRWRDFKNFLADMGDRPFGQTIDRIDSKKGYYPKNCRWATRLQQGQNTSRNVRITVNGETLVLSEWSRRLNISKSTLSYRYRHGVWP